MDFRSVRSAAGDWRDQINRSLAPSSTSQFTIRIVFALWLVAFLTKHVGSSWDIAWHFRYPFGLFEPPHVVNIFGSAIATALIIYHIMTGQATNRTGLYLMQAGFIVFLISVPLDALNHYLFGLDVTVWSPTHLLTFAGTTILLIGVLHNLVSLVAPGRWRLALGLGLWLFLLDDALFQLSQQEYGVIAIDAYARGQSSASAELLALAGRNPAAFAEGGIPHWVYPVWLILTSTLVLVAAHRVLGWRWSATAAALLYLAYRAVIQGALLAVDFPQSFIPVMLLLAAFLIDVSEQRRWHAFVASLALVAVYYVSAALIERYFLMPRFALLSAPFVFAALWAGFGLESWRQQRRNRKFAVQVAFK